MKNNALFLYAAMLPVFCLPAGAQTPTAFEALNAAAGGPEAFDGQAARYAPAAAHTPDAPDARAIPAPPPPEKSRFQPPVLDWQEPIIAKAKCAFQYADAEARIEQLNKSGKISVEWSNELALIGDPYAFTRPAGPDGKRVVYLNTVYKDMLMAPHPGIPYSFLSSVLAHEFQHQADFEAAGLSREDNSENGAVRFMLELSAYTREVYLYAQLHHQRLVPDLANETKQEQEIRLYSDIYLYMNGGGKPEAKYYPQLEFLKYYDQLEKKTVLLEFDSFITKVAYPKDKGIWSLASLVSCRTELPYDLKNPPADKRKLKQYKAIKDSLEKGEADFRAWRKKLAAAAAAAQQHSSSGGSSSGHTPKPPSHSGSSSAGSSSGHSGSSPVIYTPGGAGNPKPPAAPNFGGGTGLDHPNAAYW